MYVLHWSLCVSREVLTLLSVLTLLTVLTILTVLSVLDPSLTSSSDRYLKCVDTIIIEYTLSLCL